ncbi:MAG TPA: NAD-dependent epimerase/dehydratase family protein, partial [Thermoanaerobaculia bacterium]|nr:NAD-dependent epimerase/dehydratase family protein [Thermoanaerobaculia bacterium]
GRTAPGLFPEAEKLRGDRGRDLAALDGRRWDAVIDVNAYLPRQVRATAERLRNAVDRYVFISTISVYRDLSVPGTIEESPLEEPVPGDEDAREVGPGAYGRLKVLCERTAEAALPGRVLHVRPCIVVGPHDPTGRFTYWVDRVAQGGEVLAPGRPERAVQIIDARDLAAWVVGMTERRETGVYNTVGPERVLPMRDLLETCRAVSGSDAAFTWVSDAFLEKHGLELPLVHPEDDAVDSSRAQAQGLTFRPLAETVRDLLRWSVPPQERDSDKLSPECEADLLREWHSRGAA